MKTFNVKIGFGENEVTLSVLPVQNEYYKIIYYGEILGAIRLESDNETWEKVPDEKLEAGDLLFFKHDLSSDRLDVILDESTVRKIGEEINAS